MIKMKKFQLKKNNIKKIGITQRIILTEKGADRDALEQDYVQYYEKLGMVLIPIPNVLSNVEDYLDKLAVDGIILSGGNDINPKLYGARSNENEKYADARDKTEKSILDYTIKRGIPVLCECRGCQFINVYFGGKLAKVQNHVISEHEVALISDSKIKFREDSMNTNSYHNFGFTKKDLGKGLKVFAQTKEGIIEGIYCPKYRMAGIMWHPERKSPNAEFNSKLIDSFLKKEGFWK